LKVCLISLGCPKNLVDSEEMLGALREAGWELETECSRADAIVVNTCGFIESAKEESVQAILEAVGLKSEGRCRSVVVVGCLSQRYGDDLRREIPEIDAIIGVGKGWALPTVLSKALEGKRIFERLPPPAKWVEGRTRVLSTPPWMAYLKIADGCDNRCAYCVIPDIRGPYRSRPRELVLAEAERLAKGGVRELALVAQDSTLYGKDLSDGESLSGLLRELCRAVGDGERWIRLMYAYPARISDDLIEVIAGEGNICKYLDVPMQHGHPDILKRMRRLGDPRMYLERIGALRRACPEIALRTTFLMGFPGETDEEFEALLEFVREIEFDRVGAFVYSREEGTPAADMRPKVPKRIAKERYARLMEAQQEISLRKNRALIGRTLKVLVEGRCENGAFGRSYRDAPEIDGIVRLSGCHARPGEFVQAKIVQAEEYDLAAVLDERIS